MSGVFTHSFTRSRPSGRFVHRKKWGKNGICDVGGGLARVGAGPDGRVRVDDGWEI